MDKFRVLWFVNAPFPEVRQKFGIKASGTGWWLSTVGLALAKEKSIKLGIAWVSELVQKRISFTDGLVDYYCVPSVELPLPLSQNTNLWKVARRLNSFRSEKKLLNDCYSIADSFSPDIIHVHGTENFYGLITPLVSTPVLISLQGVLQSIYQNYWGSLKSCDENSFPKEKRIFGQMLRNKKRELEIFRINKFFTGRTDWDHAQQLAYQPNGFYYSDGARVLRNIFYTKEWQLSDCNKFSVYTTTSLRPYKGTDVLLDAIAILKKFFPSICLFIGGEIPNKGFGKYLYDKTHELEINNNVQFLGYQSPDQIALNLINAHVFVLPSFIENSPNSLAEAQVVGTPCIASFTGGIPTMVKDGETGLLFPKGDASALAFCIKRIFEDARLALKVSRQSRIMGLEKHDTEKIVVDQLDIYERVIKDWQVSIH